MSAVLGVIVAGGSGSRMGTDKALVELGGLTLLQHATRALEAAGLTVIVSGRSAAPGGFETVPDLTEVPGGGPALGLLSVFRRHRSADLFLVAVDQPLLQPATVTQLLQKPGDVVVPVVGQHPQVTCALYRNGCLQPLEEMLADGVFRLRSLLPRVSTTRVTEDVWASWGEDGRSWLSLDTPQAVRDAEDLL
jgi:molybdopterin-guanine dinucleotide biosynthesis protein A